MVEQLVNEATDATKSFGKRGEYLATLELTILIELTFNPSGVELEYGNKQDRRALKRVSECLYSSTALQKH